MNKKIVSVELKTFSFDEDLYPTGTFQLESLQVENVNLETGELTFRFLNRDDRDRYYSKLAKLFEGSDAYLGFNAKYKQAPDVARPSIIKALNALSLQAVKKQDYDKADQFKQNAESAIAKQKRVDKEWAKNLKKLNENALKVYFSFNYEGAIPVPDTMLREFFTTIQYMHRLKPKAFSPFLPAIKLIPNLNQESKINFIRELKTVNEDKTHAYLNLISRISLYDHSKYIVKFHVDDLLAICEVFPDDELFSLYLDVMKSKERGDKNDRNVLLKSKTILDIALNNFVEGNYDEAVKHLIHLKHTSRPAIAYRLLAIIRLAQSDFSKAVNFIARLPYLSEPNFNDFSDLSLRMMKDLFAFDGVPDNFKLERKEDIFLKTLYKIFKQHEKSPLQLHDIHSTLDEAYELIMEDPSHLMMVYPVLNILRSKLVHNKESQNIHFKASLEKLFKLMSLFAQLSFKRESVTQEMRDMFELEYEDCKVSMKVAFDHISFGDLERHKSDKAVEVVSQKLRLTDESILYFSDKAIFLLHDMVLGILFRISNHQNINDSLIKGDVELPDNPDILESLISDSVIPKANNDVLKSLQNVGLVMLNKYLKLPDKPYELSDSFINWAVFCLSRSMRENQNFIRKYPEIVKHFSSMTALEIKNVDGLGDLAINLCKKNNLDPIKFTRRELFGIESAFGGLQDNRTLFGKSFPSDLASFYDVFLVGQSAFGYSLTETFDEWDQRLKSYLDFLVVKGKIRSFDDQTDESKGFGLSLQSKKVFPVILALQRAWMSFIDYTKQKNDVIQHGQDDDEKEAPIDSILRNYLLIPANKEAWITISSNEKDDVQSFLNTHFGTKKNHHKELNDLIHSKRKHVIEVKELKKYWGKLYQSHHVSDAEKIKLAALFLLNNAEDQRSETHHSVYSLDKNMAFSVCMLLIEASLQSAIQDLVIKNGASSWFLNEDSPNQVNEIFEHINGSFHGPEIHLTGAGPTHEHFNVGIYVNGSWINTHIYFG